MGYTRNLRDGTIYITDGTTPTANDLEVTVDEGDLSWTEDIEVKVVHDRGTLDHFRSGNEVPCSLRFTVKYQELFVSSGDPTFYQAMKKVGQASSWESTVTDSDLFHFHLDFYVAAQGSNTPERMRFEDCVLKNIQFSEGDEYNTVQAELVCLKTAPTLSKTALPT